MILVVKLPGYKAGLAGHAPVKGTTVQMPRQSPVEDGATQVAGGT